MPDTTPPSPPQPCPGPMPWETPLITSMLKTDPVDIEEIIDSRVVTPGVDVGSAASPAVIVAVVAVAATVAKSDEVIGRLTLEERGALAGRIKEIRANPELIQMLAVGRSKSAISRIGAVDIDRLAGGKALDDLERRLKRC